MNRVVLHVDQLVLKGVEQADRHRVAFDLQGELSRLLADPSVFGQLASLSHLSSMRVGKEGPAPGGQPERPGISAARAIARGLSR